MIARLTVALAELDTSLLDLARIELEEHRPARSLLDSHTGVRVAFHARELEGELAGWKARELGEALDAAELVQARAAAVAVECGA